MLKSSREEDQRKRDEALFYSIQQQIDELRRQLKENLTRQQWFEELYKQSQGKLDQLVLANDRLAQDVAQALHARQIDEGRMKAQIADLSQRIELPDKQIRDLRAQIHDLLEMRKEDRETDAGLQRSLDDLQRQIRDIHSHISRISDAHRQLRDLIEELASGLAEVRQEIAHTAELQRLEEQRLRRSGMELQQAFEDLRQQFSEIAARSQRVDEVRNQLTERIEAIEEQFNPIRTADESLSDKLERIERLANEQYLTHQERLEAIRLQLESQISEMRQIDDQRMDRYMGRFTSIDERLRAMEQQLSDMPRRFEALEQRGEALELETDRIEEWLVMRHIEALESVLDDVRKRHEARGARPGYSAAEERTPGSIYNPAGLIKSVRDARPPKKSVEPAELEDEV
jgi:DNA repair exonuclease SbcCD ATPase subunit